MSSQQDIVLKRNQWLSSHVEVDYPTPESIKGKALYFDKQRLMTYERRAVKTKIKPSGLIDDIYLVDFHRLTVMFAQLQSTQWENVADQAFVLEFFAQISLADEHPIYLGFKKGMPVISALVTEHNGELLISDIATSYQDTDVSIEFADMVMNIVNHKYNYAYYLING